MAEWRLPMPKMKEILRLYHESELSRLAMASNLNISRSTVTNVLTRAETADVGWRLPAHLPAHLEDEEQLESTLYPAATGRPRKIAEPDWSYIHQELRKMKGVTLQLLWIEYKREHQDGYQYSQFYTHYRQSACPFAQERCKLRNYIIIQDRRTKLRGFVP